MVLALLIAIPVGVLITGGILAALLGEVTKRDTDARFEGTEYLDISRGS